MNEIMKVMKVHNQEAKEGIRIEDDKNHIFLTPGEVRIAFDLMKEEIDEIIRKEESDLSKVEKLDDETRERSLRKGGKFYTRQDAIKELMKSILNSEDIFQIDFSFKDGYWMIVWRVVR